MKLTADLHEAYREYLEGKVSVDELFEVAGRVRERIDAARLLVGDPSPAAERE